MIRSSHLQDHTQKMQRLFLTFIFGMIAIIALAFAAQPHARQAPNAFMHLSKTMMLSPQSLSSSTAASPVPSVLQK
jgi:hypothetical protein